MGAYLETQCPECRRAVGVVAAPSVRGERQRYKLAVHASSAPVGYSKARRPRCFGAGMEMPRGAIWETDRSPARRKREDRQPSPAR